MTTYIKLRYIYYRHFSFASLSYVTKSTSIVNHK